MGVVIQIFCNDGVHYVFFLRDYCYFNNSIDNNILKTFVMVYANMNNVPFCQFIDFPEAVIGLY